MPSAPGAAKIEHRRPEVGEPPLQLVARRRVLRVERIGNM